MGRSPRVGLLVAVTLMVSLVTGSPALAASASPEKVWVPPDTPLAQTQSVPGSDEVPNGGIAPPYPVPPTYTPTTGSPAAAGTATVDLSVPSTEAAAAARATGGAAPAAAANAPRRAGSLPVYLAAPSGARTRSAAQAPGPVQVQLVGAAATKAVGAGGPVVALRETTEATAGGTAVHVTLDVKALTGETGAGWADRARLVALPACSLTTPTVATCQKQTLVASTVDATTGMLSADVTVPARTATSRTTAAASSASGATQAQPLVLAAQAAPAGSMGGYAASSLNPSAAWGAGSNTGNFTYSYAMQMPASLGGAAPQVGLSYDSSQVDGKTSSTNAQSSWIGDGWDYQSGSIERSYRSCTPDGIDKSGDECWGGQSVTLNLGGHSGTLVLASDGTWHLQGDDGSKIEQLYGAINGANKGEYWKVSTTDGMVYYFGQNHLPGGDGSDPATNSAWTVPVYSPNSGDDCYDSAKGKDSWCTEAYRWNLDYVVDPHGNLTTYKYATQTNSYARGGGQNSGTGTLTAYTSSGNVAEIDYGQRLSDQIAAKGAAKAAAQVLFGTQERCVASGTVTCTVAQRVLANQSNWADTPLDQYCDTKTPVKCTNYSPTFWSDQQLATVTTSVLVGTAYRPVDSWALKHAFVDPSDGTTKTLWLSSITRTGSNGQANLSLPSVSFTPYEIANRVDGLVPAAPMYNRPRIQQITTETGGQINVHYNGPECSRVNNHMPSSEDQNTMACMPVKWYQPSYTANTSPVNDWFNKVTVSEVTEQDTTTSAPLKVTDYTYTGGTAWHRNDGQFTDPKTRTWDNFRGYQSVTTTTGSAFAGEAPKTETVTTYLRGMDGDILADGSKRSVQVAVPDPRGGTAQQVTDSPWLVGSVLASQTYDQAGSTNVVAANWTTEANPKETARQTQLGGMPDLVAYYGSAQATTVQTAKLAAGGWRTTTKVTTSDPDNGNRPTTVDDQGDGTATVPEQCTTTSYATSSNAMFKTLPLEEKTIVGPCGTAGTAANTVSDSRFLYDNQPLGQAGATANLTSTQTLDHYDSTGAAVYTSATASTFDSYGRVSTSTAADGALYNTDGTLLSAGGTKATTTTTFTPATGALPTSSTVTGPMGTPWKTVSTIDPGRGDATLITDPNNRSTTINYDALGRVTAVWQPTRATSDTPSQKFSYAVNGYTANPPHPASVITSQTLNGDGTTYSYQTEIYDGLGRLRQTQAESPTRNTGRLITDTVYDSHGWPVKTAGPYYDSTTLPNSTVYAPIDGQVPAQSLSSYDGQGRVVQSTFSSYGTPQWSTSTAYKGVDQIDVTAPAGGTATSTFTDARGRTTALWQYRTAAPTDQRSDADVTSYTYTPVGQAATRQDQAGNTWSYGYDTLGRQTKATDPDTGTSTTSYDTVHHTTTVTDARGTSVTTAFDLLGRKTGQYAGTSVNAAQQTAGWTYDSLVLGQPTASTRYVGGASGSAYTTAVVGYTTDYQPTGTTLTIPASETGLAGTYTTSYDYTPVSRLLNWTQLPAVGGLPSESLTATYDNSGNLASSGGIVPLVTDMQYDPLGRAQRTTLGSYGTQVVSTQNIDAATGRVTASYLDKQTATQGAVDQTAYTYNAGGQLTSASDIRDNTPATGTDTQCYTYDYLGRLTQAWTDTAGTTTSPMPSVPSLGGCKNATGPAHPGTGTSVGGPAPYWQSYGYDSTGNRTTFTQHDITGNTANDAVTTQSFNTGPNTPTSAPGTGGGTGGPHSLNKSTTVSPAGTKTTSYQYDAGGNTTAVTDTSGTTTLTWNGEDKLDTLTATGQTQGTSYLYDADGNPLIRRNTVGNSKTLFAGSDELTYFNGPKSQSDTRYYSAPGGLTATRTSGGTANGTLYYEAADAHGTNGVQITAASPQTVTRRPTDPFGNTRGTTPTSWAGDKGFVGGTQDTTTGLTNLGAREYDPVHGRFLNPDPLLDTSQPQQWNGYAYSSNDPVNASDPTGLMYEAGDGYGMPPATSYQPADFCVTLSCAQETSTAAYANDQAASASDSATTSSDGNGSGGNSDTSGDTGGGGGGSHCGSWLSWSGLSCHTNNGVKHVQHYMTQNPIVKQVIVTVAEGATYAGCWGAAGLGAAETGGATLVAGAAGCGAAAGAVGGALNNVLTEGADHSIGGVLKDSASGAVVGAVTGAATMGAGLGLSSLATKISNPLVSKAVGMVGKLLIGDGGGCKNSFPAGTLVALANGTYAAIDHLKVGDLVLATDPQTGATKPEPVTATIIGNYDTDFTTLTLIADAGPRAPPIAHQHPATAETITSTAHHPFWDVTTGRWTDATDLHVGDRLRQTGSSTSTVTKVENTYTAPQTEYNLTVNDLHAYYVDAGIAPILVHNSECPNNIHAEGEDCHCDNPLEPGTRKGDATAEAVDKATQIFKDVHDHSLQKTGTAKVGDSNIKHTFPSGPTDIILGSAAAIHLIAIGVKSGIKWWLRRSAE